MQILQEQAVLNVALGGKAVRKYSNSKSSSNNGSCSLASATVLN